MESSLFANISEGTIITAQGSAKKVMYKILSGKVILYLNYGEKDEHVVGILSEGRCFGELTILCGCAQPHTVVAYEDVRLLRVTEENFDGFIQGDIENAKGIMRNLGNTLLTLSTNVNLLLGELNQEQAPSPENLMDITQRIRRFTHGLSAPGGRIDRYL